MSEMHIVMISLFVMGSIGSLDEFFYHYKSERLLDRPESFLENILHILRVYVYAILFLVSANYEAYGAYASLLLAVIIFDGIIGVADILSEEKSRESLGGLKNKEYLLHMLLSFNLGILYFNYIPLLWKNSSQPSFLTAHGNEFRLIQYALNFMGICSVIMGVFFTYLLLKRKNVQA